MEGWPEEYIRLPQNKVSWIDHEHAHTAIWHITRPGPQIAWVYLYVVAYNDPGGGELLN